MRVRRELCVRQLMSLCDILEQTDILTLARHCCFLAMWRGASQLVVSAYWLPNVVRMGSRPRPLCLFVLSGKYVLWPETGRDRRRDPSRHVIWLAGRHWSTMRHTHTRLCWLLSRRLWRFCVACVHDVTLLSIFCCTIGPTGSIMNKLLLCIDSSKTTI